MKILTFSFLPAILPPMKMWTSSVLAIVFMLASCTPEDDLAPPIVNDKNCMETYEGALNILWSTPIRKDTSVSNSILPVIFDDDILFTDMYFLKPNTIHSFNPETGEKQWSFWTFPHELRDEVIHPNNPSQEFDNKFYFNYGRVKALFNAKTEQLEWSDHIPYSGSRISAGKEYAYSIKYNEGGIIFSSEILRKPLSGNGEWESIFKRERHDNESQHLNAPSEWISPNGDVIIVFLNSRFPDGSATKSNLVAFNTTQNEIQWEIEEFVEGGSTVHVPLIHGNKGIISNARSISYIDLLTGKELWETDKFVTGFTLCAPVIAGDILVANGSDEYVLGISLEDGSIVWEKNDSDRGPTNMVYYEGAVYYCTNDSHGPNLYGLNAINGEVILREESPYKDCYPASRFSWGLSIDQETGKLYTHDGYYAMCLQLDKY